MSMALELTDTVEIIETMENFLVKKRPPVEIRDQLDIGYSISGQDVIIFEIRPAFMKPTETVYPRVAKATWVKSKRHWKIYWERADLRWHSYEPVPIVKTLKAFVRQVELDEYGCFWG
jgi:hypothetical protein